MSDDCPTSCLLYWSKHEYNPPLICPGCETWVDESGRKWRKLNLPDGYPTLRVSMFGDILGVVKEDV